MMYVPKHFEEVDRGVLHALIESHPLSTWVVNSADGLIVNHIPLLLSADAGSLGTLVGHVARANPVWQTLSATEPSVAVFQGPESYISPSWYQSKQQHGKAVPTWNYAVVHAHGIARAIEDVQWLRDHVTRLSATHEARQAVPWRVSDAAEEYIGRMLEAIVGIEIPIVSLVGKWKVSQNRPRPDRQGVIAGLEAQSTARSQEMANLVAARLRPGV